VDKTAGKVPTSSLQIIETSVQRTSPQTYDEHYLQQDHIQEPIVEETMDTWELITNTKRKRKTSSPATTHTVTPPSAKMPVKRNRFELTEHAPLFPEDVEKEHTEEKLSPQVMSPKSQRQQVFRTKPMSTIPRLNYCTPQKE